MENIVHPYALERGIPAISVGIYVDVEQFFASFGKHPDTGKRVNKNTLYGIGPVNKVFHSLILARLIAEKKISLNTRIVDYLPEDVREQGDAIKYATFKQVATNTAGMSSLVPGKPGGQLYNNQPPSRTLRRYWKNWKRRERGAAEYEYSATEAVTLAFAVAEAAGMGGYNPALRHLVLDPLGMDHTYTLPRIPDKLRSRVVPGYGGQRDQPKDEAEAWRGIHSSTSDMIELVAACLKEHGTAQEMIRAINLVKRQHVERPGRQKFMGLGWFIDGTGRDTTVHHGGTLKGYSAYVAFMPERKIGLVLLSNGHVEGNGGEIGKLGRELLDELTKSKRPAKRTKLKKADRKRRRRRP